MSHIYEKEYVKLSGIICSCILCKFNYSCTATTKNRESNNCLNVTEDSMQ